MVPSPAGIAIFLPLTTAVGVIVCTIVIHALAVIAIVHFVLHERRVGRAGVRFWTDVTIVVATALLALVAHLIEIAAWAGVLILCGEFPHFAEALYHSATNYTSLGDGNVVISGYWKLLGPLETADGLLMFGVSTAMLFAVIQRLVQTRFRDSDG
jgi:Ion channel